MLLALSLMVSMLAIGAVATDDANPTITSAVAINDTQFKITTSEPVTVKNTGTFALFLAKNGVVDNLNERSNAQYKETGTRYLDISGAEIRESSAAVPVLIYPMGNERYQLITSGHMLTIDNDAGEGNDAVISHVKKSEVIPIRYAWYITEENAIRPLKVMPLGDSITYGVNSTLGDGEWKRVGYREMLSEQLTEYFGRVVFVGSQVTTVTTAEETRLLRHEGHPGWVVDQGYLLGLTTNDKRDGLSSIIDGSMEKYAPDIVCLMIGTNDLGVLRNNTSYTETERNGWLAVYEKFVLGIEEKLPNNGLVICSSITPNKDSSWDVYTKSFGEAIMTRVEAMAEDGAKVCVADNYGAVSNAIAELGVDAVFADSVHLKAAGSEAMAWEYLSVIKNNYNSNSIKGNHIAMIGDVKYNSFNDALLAVKVGQTIVLNDDVTVKDTLFVLDAGVVLDLNGHELSVNNVLAFGDIIDSTEGIGKLVRNQNARVILNAENSAMPLYDTNGYRFFTYTLASAGPKNGTTDSVQFGVQLTFANTDAYALLAKDVTTTIKLALAVTKDDKVTNLTFIFKQGTLEQYKDAWNNRTDLTKTPTLVLTVSGIEGVDSISCTPSISQSATTVIRTGSALFYSPIA